MSLHTHINAHKEILEIQADTGTVGCCNLLIELVELEHTARLVFIASDGPDVTGIKEQAQLNDPEQLGTILQVDIKADVTTLVDKVGKFVVAVITARTQGAHAPTAHAVGTTAVESFLKGQHVAVAIGYCHTRSDVESDALATIQIMGKGIVGIGLHILRVADAQSLVAAILVSLLARQMRQPVQQVSRRLDIGTDGEHVTLETSHLLHAHLGLVGAIEVVAHPHDQVVLITVEQQWIGDGVKSLLELVIELGHTDDAHVKQCQRVRQAPAALRPLVAPSATGDDTCVLGTCLVVKVDGEGRRGLNLALEGLLQQREHELGEGHTQLGGIFTVVVIDQATQVARDTLIGHLGLGTQHLTSLEDVAVLIVHTDAEAQVTLAIGTLQRHRHALGLVMLQQHPCVNHEHTVHFTHRPDVYIDLFEHIQAPQRTIGAVHGFGAVEGTGHNVITVFKNVEPQVTLLAFKNLHTAFQHHRVHAHEAVTHGNGVIVGHIYHIPHIERLVFSIIGHTVIVVGLTHVQRQVHTLGVGCGIGDEGDVLLVKGIVALVAQ